MDKRISIIIPSYNEEQTIQTLIEDIKKLDLNNPEIIVVDDGSTDKTSESIRSCGVKVIRHPYNMGNGAAIKTGIRHSSGDIIVMMDADGQHNPDDISKLLYEIGRYDMVIGARNINHFSLNHRDIANYIYNLFATYVAGIKIHDLTSGFRAIRKQIAQEFISLLPNGFSYPTTLTLGLIKSGYGVKFLPIAVNERIGKSKIKLLRDGIRFFLIIFKIASLYSPLRVFLPVSFAFFLLGMINYVHTLIAQNRFTNMSALLMSTSVIIFMMGFVAEQIAQLRFDRIQKK
jgi:glycosyltransferase involved in cell wall biosynthesis